MDVILIGLGIALVMEGVLYAAMPQTMRKMIVSVLAMPEGQLRITGLIAALLGLLIVALVKG